MAPSFSCRARFSQKAVKETGLLDQAAGLTALVDEDYLPSVVDRKVDRPSNFVISAAGTVLWFIESSGCFHHYGSRNLHEAAVPN